MFHSTEGESKWSMHVVVQNKASDVMNITLGKGKPIRMDMQSNFNTFFILCNNESQMNVSKWQHNRVLCLEHIHYF